LNQTPSKAQLSISIETINKEQEKWLNGHKKEGLNVLTINVEKDTKQNSIWLVT
jgi:hypothetical protein